MINFCEHDNNALYCKLCAQDIFNSWIEHKREMVTESLNAYNKWRNQEPNPVNSPEFLRET